MKKNSPNAQTFEDLVQSVPWATLNPTDRRRMLAALKLGFREKVTQRALANLIGLNESTISDDVHSPEYKEFERELLDAFVQETMIICYRDIAAEIRSDKTPIKVKRDLRKWFIALHKEKFLDVKAGSNLEALLMKFLGHDEDEKTPEDNEETSVDDAGD